MKTNVAILALLFLAGCSFSGGRPGITMHVDASEYARGAEMGIEVRNESFRSVTVHPQLCLARFETTDGLIIVTPDQVCTLVGYTLHPGATLQTTRVVPDTLAVGRYRLRYNLAGGETIRSRVFDVN